MLSIVSQALSSAKIALGVKEKNLKIIVAVSGGADSVCLLDIVCRLASDLGITVIVANVDHGLRKESAEEARFVEELAAQYGVPFELYSAESRPAGENLEAWGRRIRYEFFNKLLEKHRADLIVTAHHANDQAETVLQRFLSGRLLTDAFAIAAFDGERKICRPLLASTRADIEAYVSERGLAFVTDLSNFDTSFNRNKLRHDLLPQLERDYNPNLIAALGSFAERFGREELYLDGQARSSFESLKRPISLKSLRRIKPVLLWRVLRLVAEEQVGDVANKLGYTAYQNVCQFVLSDVQSLNSADLGFGVRVAKEAETLCFSQIVSRNKAPEYGGDPGNLNR